MPTGFERLIVPNPSAHEFGHKAQTLEQQLRAACQATQSKAPSLEYEIVSPWNSVSQSVLEAHALLQLPVNKLGDKDQRFVKAFIQAALKKVERVERCLAQEWVILQLLISYSHIDQYQAEGFVQSLFALCTKSEIASFGEIELPQQEGEQRLHRQFLVVYGVPPQAKDSLLH